MPKRIVKRRLKIGRVLILVVLLCGVGLGISWGIKETFSYFDKSVELADVLKYDLPYADGYTGFWNKPLTLQHPLSKIEIVPWDSSLTLILSENKELVSSFMRSFPYSQNLEDYIDKTSCI